MSRHVIAITSCVFAALTVCSAIELGEVFESPFSRIGFEARGVFLLGDVKFGTGYVYKFRGMFVHQSPVRFQIWRPVDPRQQIYELVGQKRFIPASVPTLYEITLEPFEYIEVRDGDQMAVYNEESTGAVAFQFDPTLSHPLYPYLVKNASEIFLGCRKQFDTIPLPYIYAASVFYETDLNMIVVEDGGAVAVTLTQPEGVATGQPLPTPHGSTVYIGNSLSTRYSALTLATRGIFLFEDLRFPYGIITRFYANFISTEPVRFQIWRPQPLQGATYGLVGEKLVVPETLGWNEIELDVSEVIFTEDGDCLGFTNEDQACPIGYNFNISMAPSTRPYMGSLQPEEELILGQIITLNALGFPYDFAVGALCDTVPDTNIYGTPPAELPSTPVPPPPTTTPPTTGPATVTVPTVPGGEMLLSQALYVTDKYLKTGAQRTFLLNELEFPTKGLVTSIWAYFVTNGSIQFDIWRMTPDTHTGDQSYTLIARRWHTVNDAPGLSGVELSARDYIEVEAGDVIGYTNYEDFGCVGYHFEATTVFTATASGAVEPGITLHFDILPFPYRFAMATTFIPAKEVTSPTPSTTTQDPWHTTKSSRPSGKSFDDWLDILTEPWVIFLILIWLIVISILLCGCCICWACKTCQKKRRERHAPYRYFTNRSGGTANSSGGDTKDDDLLAFYNATGINVAPTSSEGSTSSVNNMNTNSNNSNPNVDGTFKGTETLEYHNNTYKDDQRTQL